MTAASPSADLTVALLGPGTPSARTLHAALLGLPTAPHIRWSVVDDDAPESSAEIVVCDSPPRAEEARRRWPAAAIIALVPARDDGSAVLVALDAGATVCVRGSEADLVAAYVHSIARRRQLVASQAVGM